MAIAIFITTAKVKIGKEIKKRNEVKDRNDYLVIVISGAGVEPMMLTGSAVLAAYYNPDRTWGLDEEIHVFPLEYRHTGKNIGRRGIVLLGIYELLKTLYQSLPQVCVYWGDDFNGSEAKMPDDCVDPNCIVVCDNSDPHYHTDELFHIDGAFSIEVHKKQISYQWWPYPEKPITGRDNILTHIIKHHLPDEYKEAATATFTKIKTGPNPKSKEARKRTTTSKTGPKGGRGKLSPEDLEKLREYGRKIGLVRTKKGGDEV